MQAEVGESAGARLAALAGALAHAARNPLNSIALAVQLAERVVEREALSERQRGAIGRPLTLIAEEGARLTRQLEAFVELARPVTAHRESTDLQALVEDAIRAAGAPAAGVGVEGPGGRVSVDRALLVAALASVIRNAWEAVASLGVEALAGGGAGGPRGAGVRVRADVREGRAVLAVADAGPGFPPRALERLGEPFFTTKPGRQGLSLARARMAAEAHGGRISARAVEGGGAEVWIEIPAE